jgi:carboxyl-terminal processing protease
LIGDGKKGGVVVVNVIPKSPAEKSGILPGDVIRSIDGVDFMGATAEAVAAKCRGETGTSIQVEIERNVNNEPSSKSKRQTITITRAELPNTPDVESSIVQNGSDRLGVLKINSFTQDTEKKVQQEMKQMMEGNPPPSAIVVDLRGNVGGYMPAGVEVAKLFLQPRARIISVSCFQMLAPGFRFSAFFQ